MLFCQAHCFGYEKSEKGNGDEKVFTIVIH